MKISVSPSYASDLLRTIRQPTLQLEALSRHWSEAKREIDRKREFLINKIAEDDPIRYSASLLVPIESNLNETLHTRALAYLLDPSKLHGLSKRALTAVIQKIRRLCPHDTEARAILALLQRKGTKISVYHEYRYRMEGHSKRSLARCDVWIELRAKDTSALIIFENKIEALETPDQLKWYEDKARSWCASRKHSIAPLLIFLTVDGRKSNSAAGYWVSLSYLQLAAALRKVWLESQDTIGGQWLGLYIASIVQGVLGIDEQNRLEDTSVDDIETYLGEIS
jgi:hypothetical protein